MFLDQTGHWAKKRQTQTCFHNDNRCRHRKTAHSEWRCVEDHQVWVEKKEAPFEVEVSEHFLKLQQLLHRQPCSVCFFKMGDLLRLKLLNPPTPVLILDSFFTYS